VYDASGAPLGRLHSGYVVVEGVIDEAEYVGTALGKKVAERGAAPGKRVRGYADKRVRPTEDKATPPRQPDPRLRNPLAGSG
jgi:hypothetical protein